MKAISLLIVCGGLLQAQTQANPETDLRALKTVDALVVNVKAGTQFPAAVVVRVPICQDRTGATCQPGQQYVTEAGNAVLTKLPAASTQPTSTRFKCFTATTPGPQVMIPDTGYQPESVQLFINGLLMNPTAFGTVVPDYAITGQAINIARTVDAVTVIRVCYAIG